MFGLIVFIFRNIIFLIKYFFNLKVNKKSVIFLGATHPGPTSGLTPDWTSPSHPGEYDIVLDFVEGKFLFYSIRTGLFH